MKNLTSYCDTRGTLSMAKTNSTYAKLPHRCSIIKTLGKKKEILFRNKTKNTIIDHDLIYISCSILSAPLVHMDSSPLCALYNRMLQQILPPKIF